MPHPSLREGWDVIRSTDDLKSRPHLYSEKMDRPECLFRKAERLEKAGDLTRAYRHLLTGARLGHTGCMVNLGNFDSSGIGTPQSLPKAARWYRRAYRLGDPSGGHNLAIDLRNQGRRRAAIRWFRRAIVLRDGDACIELARFLRNPDRKRAVLKQALACPAQHRSGRTAANKPSPSSALWTNLADRDATGLAPDT